MSRHHRRLSSARWARLREYILVRDKRRCRECGKAGLLEVHHVRPLDLGGAEWDPDNLQALCRSCHFGAHREIDPERQAWKDYMCHS